MAAGGSLLLVLLATALWQGHVCGQGTSPRGPVNCPSLQAYVQTYSNCSPLPDCSGVLCRVRYPREGLGTSVDGNASFVANKCEDPITADVSVVLPDLAVDFHHTFIPDVDMVSTERPHPQQIVVEMSRSDEEMEIVVQSVDNDTVTYLVPVVQLPINATQCMCQSMDSLARDVQLNQLNQLPGLNFQYSCARAGGRCDTVNCVVAIAAVGNYTASMMVDSCHDPPAISIVVLDSGENEVYSGSFDHSQTVDIPCFGLTCTLEVTIEHHQYSMDVTVNVGTPFQPYTILPQHTIILDRSNCPDVTTAPPTITTTDALQPETCESLQRISDSSSYCSTDVSCTAVECLLPPSGDHLEMSVLPCNNPPAVRVTVTELDGHVVYDQVITDSAVIPVQAYGVEFLQLNVTIHNTSTSITVKVDAIFPRTPPINIIPETSIPINTTACATGTDTSTGTTDTTDTPTTHTDTPTTHTDTLPPTGTDDHTGLGVCDTMTNISLSLEASLLSHLSWQLECVFLQDVSCYSIHCLSAEGKLVFTVLDCNHPPAVRISSSGRLVANHTFTQSEGVPVMVDNSPSWLNVSLQLSDSGLGLAVYLSGDTLVPYTTVAVDTTGCGDDQGGKGEGQKSESDGLLIPIVVSVSAALGLLVVFLVLVALGLFWRRWRTRRRPFEPVRLTDVQDDDDMVG